MSAPTSAYTFALRVLLCPRCGAPMEALPAGGSATCKFCHAPSQLSPRAFAPPPGPRLPEAERLRRLATQTGKKIQPSPRILPLFPRQSSESGTWRHDDVLAAWQSARARTAARGPDAHDAAIDLQFLTVILANAYVERQDWRGHRALHESALDAVFLPEHRTVIASELGRGACRENDLVAAATWLGLCDAYSDDLYADSNYRRARATLASKRGDFREVLATLGSRSGEVPLHETLVSACTATRANALEMLGDLDTAVYELDDHMGIGPEVRRLVVDIVNVNGLCLRSFPIAHARVRERASIVAAETAGGRDMGRLVNFLSGRDERDTARAETARRLAIEGRDAKGLVLSVQDTGTEIDDLPLYRLRVRVTVDGVPPFESAIELLLSKEQAERFDGTVLFLLADPRDPRILAAEAYPGRIE